MGSSLPTSQLIAALAAWRRRDFHRRLAEAGGALLVCLLFAGVALGTLELLLDPSRPVRAALGGLAAAALVATVFGALLHLVRRPRDLEVAWSIERGQEGRLAAQLATAIQYAEAVPRGIDPDLVDACARQALEKLEGEDPARGISMGLAHRLAMACFAGFVGLMLLCGGEVRASLQLASRFLAPALGFELPVPVRFRVTPGDARLLAGTRFAPTCVVEGDAPGELVAVRTIGSDPPEAIGNDQIDLATGQLDFGPVHESFTYRFELGAYRSATYQVEVVDPPRPTEVVLRFEFPDHTELPDRTQRGGERDVVAPRGTRVTVEATVDRALQAAALEIAPRRGGDPLRIEAALAADGKSFTATLPVETSGTWRILLTDRDGFEDPAPPRHRLVAEEDTAPRVYVLEPGRDQEGVPGPGPVLPLKLHAEDNYALRRLAVEYVLRTRRDFTEKETTFVLEVPLTGRPSDVTTSLSLDLSGLQLVAGDVVSYRALARDARPGDGEAGLARSHRYRVHVPFPRDEHKELVEDEEAHQAGLEALTEEQKDWEKRLDRTLRDASADGEITWKERRELEALLEEQKQIRVKAQDMAARMEETLQEAQKADILDEQVEEKMRQVQSMLREVADEKMHQRLQELRELMSQVKVDPGEIKELRKRYDEEAHSKSLERMLEALKKLKAQQEIEKLAAEVGALVEDQEKLLEETASREQAGEDVAPLAQEQAALKRRAEEVLEELESLSGDMDEEAGDEAKKGVEDARDAIKEGDSALEQMEQAEAKLGEQKAGQAQAFERKAARRLRQAQQALESAAAGLQSHNRAVNLEQVVKMVRLGLDVSQAQEGVVEEAYDDAKDPRQMCRRLASDQDTLYRGIHRFEGRFEDSLEDELELKEQFVTAVADLVNNFHDAKVAFEQVKPFTGRQLARTALVKLNQVLAKLLDIQEEIQDSMSQAQMQQMMEQLERMAKQQQMLNKDTQRLERDPQDAAKQRQMAQEMAEDQRQLREQLEQMRQGQEGEDDGEGMGEKLGELGKDMEAVEEALRQMAMDEQTRQQQRRIVTRMLDMAQSLQKQGESKQREAERAGRYEPPPPPPSPPDLAETRRRFFENKEREGSPDEDREAVSRYLDLLSSPGDEELDLDTLAPELDLDPLDGLDGPLAPLGP